MGYPCDEDTSTSPKTDPSQSKEAPWSCINFFPRTYASDTTADTSRVQDSLPSASSVVSRPAYNAFFRQTTPHDLEACFFQYRSSRILQSRLGKVRHHEPIPDATHNSASLATCNVSILQASTIARGICSIITHSTK